MGKIIHLRNYRANAAAITDKKTMLSRKEAVKIEQIRDSIEVALEKVAETENMPLTVAMAAGRYAATKTKLEDTVRRGRHSLTETSAEARAVPARSPHLGRVRLPLAARPPARPGQVLQVRELDAVEGVRGAWSGLGSGVRVRG